MKRPSSEKASVQELAARYEDAAARHGDASLQGDHRAANAQYKRLVDTWKALRREGAEGRAAVARLLDHGNPHVQVWAASHVLEFEPGPAEALLERLARGPHSTVRLDAEMTLKEWRAGNLKFTED